MAGSLNTVFIVLSVFTLCSALSFPSRVAAKDEQSFEYPGKGLDVEDKELRELAEDTMRGRQLERDRERLRRLGREREREREEGMKLRNELRRERERKGRHETRRIAGEEGFSPDSAIPVVSENRPASKEKTRAFAGKHRGREEEVEKERTDHHGRNEKERIHKMERERLRQRKINGQMRQEFEKEMKGHRQRFMKAGNGRLREQEERVRARSRARGDLF